jgi:hypothetical protein
MLLLLCREVVKTVAVSATVIVVPSILLLLPLVLRCRLIVLLLQLLLLLLLGKVASSIRLCAQWQAPCIHTQAAQEMLQRFPSRHGTLWLMLMLLLGLLPSITTSTSRHRRRRSGFMRRKRSGFVRLKEETESSVGGSRKGCVQWGLFESNPSASQGSLHLGTKRAS